MKNTRKLGFLIGSWDAPGAPGIPSRSVKIKVGFPPFYFARGLDFRIQEGYINRMHAVGVAGNRKDDMDWLGLLIPLKWAVVLVVIYFILSTFL